MPKRPTEIALVSDLLMQEAESVEELAWAVIQALDADRAKRETYVIRVAVGGDTFGLGPFVSRSAAEKAARAMHPEASDELIKGCVARLFPPSMLDTEEVAPKVGTYCDRCSHPMVAHDWPKARVQGCVVGYSARLGPGSGCQCGRALEAVA